MGVGGGWGGVCVFFFFNDTATTEIYTLSLHDALPISQQNAVVELILSLEQAEAEAGLVETGHRGSQVAAFERRGGGKEAVLGGHGSHRKAQVGDARGTSRAHCTRLNCLY